MTTGVSLASLLASLSSIDEKINFHQREITELVNKKEQLIVELKRDQVFNRFQQSDPICYDENSTFILNNLLKNLVLQYRESYQNNLIISNLMVRFGKLSIQFEVEKGIEDICLIEVWIESELEQISLEIEDLTELLELSNSTILKFLIHITDEIGLDPIIGEYYDSEIIKREIKGLFLDSGVVL